MFGSDPSESLNIEQRKEESTQPKSDAKLIPLNAAVSVSATTIVQIDLGEAIVFMVVFAIVLYLMIAFMRSAKSGGAS